MVVVVCVCVCGGGGGGGNKGGTTVSDSCGQDGAESSCHHPSAQSSLRRLEAPSCLSVTFNDKHHRWNLLDSQPYSHVQSLDRLQAPCPHVFDAH